MRMHSPTRRTRHIFSVLAVPVAIVAAAALVWTASYSAFTDETRNSGNSWAAGAVALTDDDGGSARFTVTGMVPGDTQTKCIEVTANSSVPGLVKMYNVNPVNTGSGIADYVMIKVEQGTPGTFASCSTFAGSTIVDTQSLSDMNSTYSSWASAAGSWATTGTSGETQSYRFTWTFDTTGLTEAEVNALQGTHTGVDFEWEIQNT
jgi:hypothetical protein